MLQNPVNQKILTAVGASFQIKHITNISESILNSLLSFNHGENIK